MAKIYINADFLDWPVDDSGAYGLEYKKLLRAYEIWRHARDRISDGSSDLYRIDCISSLKRAVNHRIKTIFQAHTFELIPTQLGKKRVLERLQEYGIVRPALIQELFEIRNTIEHDDAMAPSIDICRNYVDVTWYFLKSTDPLVNLIHTDIDYWSPDGDETVTISVKKENMWRQYGLYTSINKNKTRVRKPKTGNWLCIENASTKKEKNEKIRVSGEFTVEEEWVPRMVADYFATYRYWSDEK